MDRWSRVVVAVEVCPKVYDLTDFDLEYWEAVIQRSLQGDFMIVDVEVFLDHSSLFLV